MIGALGVGRYRVTYENNLCKIFGINIIILQAYEISKQDFKDAELPIKIFDLEPILKMASESEFGSIYVTTI